MRNRHTIGGAALSLATATVSALALTGLAATSAQALPASCETSIGRILGEVRVSCEGGTGSFKVWAQCDDVNQKLPSVRVLGQWTMTDLTDTVHCPPGTLVSDGGYYVTEIPMDHT